MRKLKLPIGIQTFEKMRSDGYAYVDKTAFVASLARDGTYFFLSRPRRFGKSLFVDTLDCAFAGRRELFIGLHLDSPESDWDWGRKHPVLRIDWSLSPPHSPQALTERIEELLALWAERWSFTQPKGTMGGRFEALVRHIAETGGEKVVVLVDEYDKPILDNLEDPILAAQLRDMLKDFYGAFKPLDPWLRFVFLTGVSSIAKAGIFSGLNNLKDITVDARYSAICGYTQDDLETVFADRLEALDLDAVRSWYNGYSWTGEAVYNPFDVLLFLDERSRLRGCPGGRDQPGAHRPDGEVQDRHLDLRVQGEGPGQERRQEPAAATAGAGLRREVPLRRPDRAPGGHRVRPGDAEHRSLGDGLGRPSKATRWPSGALRTGCPLDA